MRFRPLHAALLIVLAAAVGLPAAAASAPSRHSARLDEIPFTVGKAFVQDLEIAVRQEQAGLRVIPKGGPFRQDIAKSRVELALVDTGLAKYDDTDAAEGAVRHAESEDNAALKEARKEKPNWKHVKAYVAAALQFKQVGITSINDLVQSIGPPAPTYGPLGACVFVTNNGNTSTETVKVTDPGAAGFPGTVNFNGQGLNQTSSFTFPSNATAFLPFNVGVFGPSTITVDVIPPGAPAQTESFQFLLGESNDKTTTDCKTQ